MEKLLDDLFDTVQETIPTSEMNRHFDRYFNQLREEIDEDRINFQRKMQNQGKMSLLLDKRKPRHNDEILLVHTKTGRERHILHCWAERNDLESMSICVPYFPDVWGWKCEPCNTIFYNEECDSCTDWGTQGQNFGGVVKCPNCEDSIRHTGDDYDPDYDTLKVIPVMLNGVGICQSKEKLKKFLGKKRRKKNKKNKKRENTNNGLDDLTFEKEMTKLPLREIKIVVDS